MKRRKTSQLLVSLVLIALMAGVGPAAAFAADADVNDPILTDAQLLEQIFARYDNDFGYKLAKQVSEVGNGELGFRNAGSKAEAEAGELILKAMKDAGLSNVRKDPVTVDGWTFGKGSLVVTSDGNKNITLSSYAGSVGTASDGITGEIVYVGDGTLAGIGAQDLKDKIAIVEMNPADAWWSQAVYQAELKGAKAVIILYNGDNYGVTQNAINSFDAQVRDTIPVMNISRADGAYLKGLIAKGAVTVRLTSDAKLEKNVQTGNIVGEIPGVMKDKYIIIGAHYDGYFQAFQDDIIGVGIFLNVAKMILDSGYKPQHTIVFTAFCAEEYGKANQHYDWVIGSWAQVNVNHPEYIGNTTVMLNFDTQRPDMKVYNLAATPEYGPFFEKYALTLNPPAPWVDGVAVLGTNGPWSDDYNYISKGIPGLMSGKGTTQWRREAYHTNLDDASVYNRTTFEFSAKHYLAMTLAFDKTLVAPLNFDTVLAETTDTLDDAVISAAGLSSADLKAAVSAWRARTGAEYEKIQQANAIYDRLRAAVTAGAADAATLDAYEKLLLENRTKGFAAYRIIEEELLKLDFADVVIYGHEIAQGDYAAVAGAYDALAAGNAKAALESLEGAQWGTYPDAYDKEVYDFWCVKAIDPSRTDLYWGQGKTLKVIDLYDVYHAIKTKSAAGSTDFKAELSTLDAKRTEAKTALQSILASEAAQVKRAAAQTAGYTLDAAIASGNAALKTAYGKLPDTLRYADVPENHWAYETVHALRLQGAITDTGSFRPSDAVTRAAFAKWLATAFNLPLTAPNFSDVDKSSADAPYIGAVARAGVMVGGGGGTFSPYTPVTRAEIVQVADNLVKFNTGGAVTQTSFKDVAAGKWYASVVESAAKAGIVQGVGENSFAPERAMTRAEAARLLESVLYQK